MADPRRNTLLNKLEAELIPYINEYKTHQESIKDRSVPAKAFFDIIHYLTTSHGEKGYKQRIKFINHARESDDFVGLLAVMKKYYNDNNSGPHTKKAIKDVCFNEFSITQEMVDKVAMSDAVPKSGNEYSIETYDSAGPQAMARRIITNFILNGNFDAIRELRIKSLSNKDKEIEMKTSFRM